MQLIYLQVETKRYHIAAPLQHTLILPLNRWYGRNSCSAGDKAAWICLWSKEDHLINLAVLGHEVGKIGRMKSYVYGSKKPSSSPTVLKLCMSNAAPSPGIGLDVQKKSRRWRGLKPDKSDYATSEERLGTWRCGADHVPVPWVPLGDYPSRAQLQTLCRSKGGHISQGGSPCGSQAGM